MKKVDLSIDVGFGNTKFYDGQDEAMFPSAYEIKNEEAYTGEYASDLDDVSHIEITFEGATYYVGRAALDESGEGSLDRNDLLRQKLCVFAAICIMFDETEKINDIVVGLPIEDMMTMKKEIMKLVGEYHIIYNGQPKTIKLENITCLAQGEGVWYGVQSKSGNIGIIDIGQKTVDYVWYDNGRRNLSRTGSTEDGCITAYREIAVALKNLTPSISVKADQVPQYMHKVPEARDKAFFKLAMRIQKALSASGGWQLGLLDKIYVAGGGAYYVIDSLKKLETFSTLCEQVEGSEYANAIGFYNYAKESK